MGPWAWGARLRGDGVGRGGRGGALGLRGWGGALGPAFVFFGWVRVLVRGDGWAWFVGVMLGGCWWWSEGGSDLGRGFCGGGGCFLFL